MKQYYFDNAATSFPKAPGVADAMARYLVENGANISRGSYHQAMDAALTVLKTREQMCKLFHFSGRSNNVVFTPGATWGLNQILRGYLRRGDHVVVSSMEHNAVMRPLQALTAEGITFSRIPADEAGRTDPMALLAVLQENTRLVVVSHASNVSGTIFPLKQVAQLCHEKGIPLAVDAAQTAGHHPIDFDGLGLAALCVPGHKGLLGPQGIGAILLEKNFAAALAPLVCGGTGSASDSEWQPAYMPDKFEAGTLNLPGIFGLHAALDFVLEQGVENFQKREAALTAQFLLGLQGLPVRVVGPGDAAAQVGVISLDFSPMDNAEAAYRLEQEFGIMTRCGLHCAPHAHQTMGTFPQGTVRFSFGHTTTEEEVDDVLQAIRRLVAE